MYNGQQQNDKCLGSDLNSRRESKPNSTVSEEGCGAFVCQEGKIKRRGTRWPKSRFLAEVSYIVLVKTTFLIVLAALLMAPSVALGQHKLDADGKEALPYVKIAADIARNVQENSLNNFLAIFITYRDSDQARQDDDLAPFVKIKQAEPTSFWSTVCFFSAKKDDAICVYFDDKKPFGVTAVKAGPNGKLGDAAGAFRKVSREMLAKNEHKLSFMETRIQTDTGAGLTGFHVTAQ